MPSFLPPAAASSEVLRTLNEQNEAQRNLEAVTADVDIALEEIKGVKAAAEVQLQNVQDAQGVRKGLEDELATAHHFAEAFAEAAKRKEAAIKAHTSTVHAEEETLKIKQKDIKDAEAAVTAAHEAKEKAEGKLTSAKAEHEKAIKRAKAAGIVPDLPATNPPAEEDPGTKSSERRRSRERQRKRSRSRSLDRRRSIRSRSRERDRRRSRSRDRRAIRESPRSRRLSPPSWRDRERERERYRERNRDRRPSPRRRSRSRGRRSKTPERRRHSLDSPQRAKRVRSRSNDSGKDAKRSRNVVPDKRPDKDGKVTSIDRRKDGRVAAKTREDESDTKDTAVRGEKATANQGGPGGMDLAEAAVGSAQDTKANGKKVDKKDEVETDASAAKGDEELPLPPPPRSTGDAALTQNADEADDDGAAKSMLPDAGKEGPLEGKEEKPKKEKKDKEAKKHKKEKKEKKESKKGKSSKAKDTKDKSVSPLKDGIDAQDD